jgi:hypothetical protein
MHLSSEELLALRDAEGAPENQRHLLQCPECASRLAAVDELRRALRRLPALEPPAGGWERILAAQVQQRRSRRARVWAAAAALLLLAATAGLLLRPAVSRSPALASVRPDDIAELMRVSRELESVLRSPSLRSPVMRPAEAARIVALEDRLALVDSQLVAIQDGPSRERALALWSGRVELLDQLVRARGRYDGRGELQHAVDL